MLVKIDERAAVAVQSIELETPQESEPKITTVPNHVAIIMDGNGRWAEQRSMPRLEGHRVGIRNIRHVIEAFAEYKVKYLTLYAFSTENWRRPPEEVNGLIRFLASAIRRETRTLHKKGVRMRHLGRLDRLPKQVQKAVLNALELTKNNDVITVCVAFDYGGRDEILRAVRQIASDGVPPEAIDEETISRNLYTNGIPDPDLIIRTAGEMRLSNFLIWQSAYSEYYFTPRPWPEFDREEVRKSLLAYSRRQRKYGGIRS
ncbi:MAG: polyprenyl diphosphate synthase [Dehalococcoidia bacterium]